MLVKKIDNCKLNRKCIMLVWAKWNSTKRGNIIEFWLISNQSKTLSFVINCGEWVKDFKSLLSKFTYENLDLILPNRQ